MYLSKIWVVLNNEGREGYELPEGVFNDEEEAKIYMLHLHIARRWPTNLELWQYTLGGGLPPCEIKVVLPQKTY